MNQNFTVLLFSLLSFVPVIVHADHDGDSVQARNKHVMIRLTCRAHSAGYFHYGGKLAEHNPAIDFAFNVETSDYGYTFLKAADLRDRHSSFNFALAGIHKNIQITEKLKVTPQAIFLIEQMHKVVDVGSDLGITLTTSYKLSPSITIEETLIVFNLIFESSHLDLTNRARMTYSHEHLDVILTGWHNNELLDNSGHATSALMVGYNRIKISKHITVGASLMGSTTFASSNHENVPERRAIVFSITTAFI